MSLNLSKPILYLITRGASTDTTTPQSREFKNILVQVSAAVAAGIELIQLREKSLTARTLFKLTEQAAALTRGTATRLLVNDRADIAAGAGADGVHLTTQSLDASTIRRTFGQKFLIGVSTHSMAEAGRARASGADFVVFGPVYETRSKQQYGAPVGVRGLTEVTSALNGFAVLALGGISVGNTKDCFAAGAIGIAGISLFSDPGKLQAIAGEVRAKGAAADEK